MAVDDTADVAEDSGATSVDVLANDTDLDGGPMTITAAGGYYNDFYAIQNGKMIKDKTAGSVAINGRVISIRQNNTAKYVIRGWLELPDMTIFEVCGPWYGDDVIPQEIFNNPNQGANLNKKWVRKK